MAADKGCTLAQLALACVPAQGEKVAPILGTKRRKYLEDTWRAGRQARWGRPRPHRRDHAAECPRYADMASVNG